ncbi:hypothetical protein F4802DRAFT_564509 [Xylaria palmicola]|nr:hypothetical protein F4802DRAFT_564509 [Xylaria palmicola]
MHRDIPPTSVPPLFRFMPIGCHSGLRWETKGYKTRDLEGRITHVFRFLLHHPHSAHISEVLFRKIGSTKPEIVSELLAKIYDFAADRVHLCQHMEPCEFWARTKNTREWSSHFQDQAFWAFTYKLFHARALFLSTVPGEHHPSGHPLLYALDRFRHLFYTFYDEDCIFMPNVGRHTPQDSINNVGDETPQPRRSRDAYFQYAITSSEGDGTDSKIARAVENEDEDPNSKRYYKGDTSLAEGFIGFPIDHGPGSPQSGDKDAYKNIEDTMEKTEEEILETQMREAEEEAEKEILEAQIREAALTRLEEVLAMMGIDLEEGYVTDFDMGQLPRGD